MGYTTGEDAEDFGELRVADNVVSVARGKRSYGAPEVVGSEGG